MKKQRLFGLDVLRTFLVIMIFLFHSHIHMGVEFDVFTDIINNGSAFMVLFFMLSGFVLYCKGETENGKQPNLSYNDIKEFYFKRTISIYPLYILCYVLYLVTLNDMSWKRNVLIAPMELSLLQSTLDGFNVSHNSGTWFISCLTICYFLFPFLAYLLVNMSKKGRYVLLGSLAVIDIWAPFITYFFELSTIYGNPFYRVLDFIVGMLCASFYKEKENIKHSYINYFYIFIVISIYDFLLGICTAHQVPQTYRSIIFVTFNNYLTVPLGILLLFLFVRVKKNKFVEKPISFFSDISYAFFLAQFWVWKLTIRIMRTCYNQEVSIFYAIVAFVICLGFASIATYGFERPIRKRLLNSWGK